MIQKAWKKNIAILLVVAMMLTIMPVAVFADGGEGGTDPVPEFVLNAATSEGFSVKAGETFSVTAKATTDSAVKVQWTIGDVTEEEMTDLTAIDGENEGTLSFPAGAKIFNNHAKVAGDDIYNKETATITFGAVGDDWALDGEPDCTDAIDGWYDDSEDNRWEAHAEVLEDNYVKEYPVSKDTLAVIKTAQALKAAHGLIIEPGEVPPIEPKDWDKSKSKTATNLEKDNDGNYKSQVTLSLPAGEEQLVSDVVFVLDKSTSADLEDQAIDMLSNLKQQIENTNAKVNVGVVIFNKIANVTEFKDLTTEYDDIVAAIKQEINSGTNTHAGLLAGKAMLDADTSVSADRKYLIFISDGITYMYNAEPTATAWTFLADAEKNWAGPDNWNSKYGSNAAPKDWMEWLKTIKTEVEQQGTQYEYPYGGDIVNATPVTLSSVYANSIDKALYLTYNEYQSAVAAGYHCYAMVANQEKGSQYEWGPSFMSYLADGKTVDFATIQNDIYYLLDAGSTVKDYMGYVEDDYNFDFVDADSMVLKVGEESYEAVKIADNHYGFKPIEIIARDAASGYAYEVTYYPENLQDEEHFVWTINVPVSNFAPVQLTYTVQLMNPKTAAGTYGEYDADGSQNKASLYTNNSATLYPVDTNGEEGEAEDFNKPTVSYTVEESTTPGGGGGGGSTTYTDRTVTKLWKNDDAANRPSSITINVLNNGEVSSQITLSEANDWIYSWKTSSGNWDVEEVNVPAGYTSSVSRSGNDFTITNTYTGIVPEEPITDPEVPTTEPTTPEEPITDPDVPTTDVPGTPVEPIAEPEVPLGDAPKTGDSSNAVPFAALALAAGAGLVIVRRKFN